MDDPEGEEKVIIDIGGTYEILSFDRAAAEKYAFDEFTAEIKRLELDYNVNALGKEDAFSDGGWCLHREGEYWIVYSSERARRSGLALFTSPFDAVNYLLWKLVATPDGLNTSVGLLPRINFPEPASH